MPTLKEINEMGRDKYIKRVLDAGDNFEEKPFNHDAPFEEQIESFNNFRQSDEAYESILKDARKFR